MNVDYKFIVVVFQSPRCVQLFATLCTSALQAPLSFSISQSLLRFIYIELVMLSHHFIAISNCPLLFPSSILDTFQPGGLIFWCHIFLPFHTVHGVLVAGILEWFAIPSSSGPRFVRTLHCGSFILSDPARHGSWLH